MGLWDWIDRGIERRIAKGARRQRIERETIMVSVGLCGADPPCESAHECEECGAAFHVDIMGTSPVPPLWIPFGAIICPRCDAQYGAIDGKYRAGIEGRN